MIEVHYGVVRIDGRWTIIGEGLRFGAYDTEAKAELIARRMADQVPDLPVHFHFQGESGEFRREQKAG